MKKEEEPTGTYRECACGRLVVLEGTTKYDAVPDRTGLGWAKGPKHRCRSTMRS